MLTDTWDTTVPPPPLWTSPQGTCVLAGDSCHSFHPFLGQNLNLALEDGASLGSLLSNVTSTMDLPKATRLYSQLRTSRAARILDETNIFRTKLGLADGALQILRAQEIAESLESEHHW
jgi:salicylate hydroxylase